MKSEDLYNQDYINIDGNLIHDTAIIGKNVKLGKGNIIGPYTVIGSPGEMRDTSIEDFKGSVRIGNNNRISELVTIQSPLRSDSETVVGSDCIIMAHAHIGHDAIIGDKVELSTGCIIGGHSEITSEAQLKLNVTVRNRIKIEGPCVVGMGSVVVQDLAPGWVYFGIPASHSKRIKRIRV